MATVNGDGEMGLKKNAGEDFLSMHGRKEKGKKLISFEDKKDSRNRSLLCLLEFIYANSAPL